MRRATVPGNWTPPQPQSERDAMFAGATGRYLRACTFCGALIEGTGVHRCPTVRCPVLHCDTANDDRPQPRALTPEQIRRGIG